MFCTKLCLSFLPIKIKQNLQFNLPNSGRTASSVGNDSGLRMDDKTRRFTAESEKRLLMLETNAG